MPEQQQQQQQYQPLSIGMLDQSIRHRPTTTTTTTTATCTSDVDNNVVVGYPHHDPHLRLRQNDIHHSVLAHPSTFNYTTTGSSMTFQKKRTLIRQRWWSRAQTHIQGPSPPPTITTITSRSDTTSTTTFRHTIILKIIFMIVLFICIHYYRFYVKQKSITTQQQQQSSQPSSLTTKRKTRTNLSNGSHNNNNNNNNNNNMNQNRNIRIEKRMMKQINAKRNRRATKMNDRDHPLLQFSTDQFPSLKQIIQQRQQQLPSSTSSTTTNMIVALYFAASWCPMSTPTTQLLDDTFRHYLLQQQQQKEKEGKEQSSTTKFILVYVSSDETFESFQSYLRPGWDCIPYTSSNDDNNHLNERNRIKQFFHTCAKREISNVFGNPQPTINGIQKTTEDIDAERWYEIPNLIILNATMTTASSSQFLYVITYHGLSDIQKYGIHAVQYWNQSPFKEETQ